jgi:hypothetical protein
MEVDSDEEVVAPRAEKKKLAVDFSDDEDMKVDAKKDTAGGMVGDADAGSSKAALEGYELPWWGLERDCGPSRR